MKPVSEWTDSELQGQVEEFGDNDMPVSSALAAEVLRLREQSNRRREMAEAHAAEEYRLRARAEKAEAGRDRYRQMFDSKHEELRDAWAALARVRALCDAPENQVLGLLWLVEKFRAAIEGSVT